METTLQFCHSGLDELAPYLIRGNPVFPSRIPAGVYPDEDRGRNNNSEIIVRSCSTLSSKILFENFCQGCYHFDIKEMLDG
jgi:hypothetical protein